MRRACLCSLVLSLAGLGCGSAPAPSTTAPVESATTSGDEATAHEERDQRIAALESGLATQSAEVRALRSALSDAAARGESVHIGGVAGAPGAEPEPDFTTLASDDDETVPTSSRPVLRLYGAPDVSVLPGPIAPPMVAAPPPGALGRLPVVLTPGMPDSVPAIPISPLVVAAEVSAPAPSALDRVIADEYRAALAHVSAREWELALASLSRFVAAHPDHAYADNAMYWCGEVLYARRDYAGAITALTSMIERFPQGNKVPDALLRIGFAYQRLGQGERAREMFRRVREQYPGTVAARSAPWEDA
jgi:tol-pal system protein YbgF